MIGGRSFVRAIVLGGVVGACGESTFFACEQDSQCRDGICQPDAGFCSFPDSECPSGQRFGEHAGNGLASTCVEPGGATTTGLEATGGSSPLATSESITTGEIADESTTSAPPACPPGWWDCDFAWRLPLDVTWSRVPQAEFPVRVSLDPGRIDLGTARPQGADLRLVGEDGTVLPHELEWISPEEGRAELWVRLPELGTGVRVWLYWGNPGAADAQDPSQVWANGYAAVWHLGPALGEGTGQHPLVDLGSADVEGQIGRARDFDGVGTLLRPSTDEAFLELFTDGGTVSAWILPVGWGQGGYGRVIDNATTNLSALGWNMAVAQLGQANPASLRFVMDHVDNLGLWESPPDTVLLDIWQHVAVTHETGVPDAEPAMYHDGVLMPSTVASAPAGDPELISPLSATIGAVAVGDARFFDGRIDELRLSDVPRSGEWIAAEAMAGLDALLVYGAPEPRSA